MGEHVTRRFEVLQKLVPDLKPKLRAMKIGDLARLAVKCKTIPHDLIELKDIFPLANVSRMVAAKPSLLYEDMGDLRRRAERLRQVLGTKSFCLLFFFLCSFFAFFYAASVPC